MLQNVFHPLLGADVGVNFCCKNAFVAEHLLHNSQVGAVFNKMGGKGMAEGVRRDFLGNPHKLHLFLDHCKDHHSGKFAATAVEEKGMVGLLGEFGYLLGRLAIGVASTVFPGT